MMKGKGVHILCIVVLLGILPVMRLRSQQLPVYSQYMISRFLLNPARAGADGYTIVEVNAREQWLGFSGAPRTHSVAFQSRKLKPSFISGSRSARRTYGARKRGGKVGIGGHIFNDQAGIVNYTGALATYAYHIRMRDQQLSFGLSASVLQYKLNKEKMILYPREEDDPLLMQGNTLYSPDASFGAYYMFPNFYAGLSATQLFQSKFSFGNLGATQYRLLRTYYLMAGYKIEIDRDFSFEPSMLYKTNERLKNQMDLSFRGYYLDDYWLGLSYRSGGKQVEDTKNAGAVVFLAGVRIDKVHIGYAFDYNLNSLQKYSYGSHELNISLYFGDNARRYRWIERY